MIHRGRLKFIPSTHVTDRDDAVAQDCRFESATMIERLENTRHFGNFHQMSARLEQSDAAHPDATDHELSMQQIDQWNPASDDVSASFLRDRFDSELCRGELENLVFD